MAGNLRIGGTRLLQRFGNGMAALFCGFLALFFGFVGYMKAFAPVSGLARHGAWTVHIPEGLGRAVGWSEMACAVMLLTGLFPNRFVRLATLGAGFLAVNQLVAATVHYLQAETGALPQNWAILGACLFIILVRRGKNPERSI